VKSLKVILIHGNGGSRATDNWLPYVKQELEKMGLLVIARDFPDNDLARASYWLPFLKHDLAADEQTVLIGHSSGALAAMRFAEMHKILGSVLVGAMHTDLGYEKEKLSGYYDKPWDWRSIKHNQRWIVQFASTDDPWIPIEEPRFIKEQLQTDYHEFSNQGHFGGDYYKTTFPELVFQVNKKLFFENY